MDWDSTEAFRRGRLIRWAIMVPSIAAACKELVWKWKSGQGPDSLCAEAVWREAFPGARSSERGASTELQGADPLGPVSTAEEAECGCVHMCMCVRGSGRSGRLCGS